MTATLETIARQAGMQASDWLRYAKDQVNEMFPDYSKEQKTALMAAMIQAAGMDEIAMLLDKVSEVLSPHDPDAIGSKLVNVSESLCSSLDNVASSLNNIASSFEGIALSLDDRIASPPKISPR